MKRYFIAIDRSFYVHERETIADVTSIQLHHTKLIYNEFSIEF